MLGNILIRSEDGLAYEADVMDDIGFLLEGRGREHKLHQVDAFVYHLCTAIAVPQDDRGSSSYNEVTGDIRGIIGEENIDSPSAISIGFNDPAISLWHIVTGIGSCLEDSCLAIYLKMKQVAMSRSAFAVSLNREDIEECGEVIFAARSQMPSISLLVHPPPSTYIKLQSREKRTGFL